jgi:hypothetical protein
VKKQRTAGDHIAHLLIGIVFIAIIASDIALVLPHSSLIEVYDSVPDEVLFYYQAEKLEHLLAAGNWHAVSAFGTPYGYGFPFWVTASLLIMVLPNAATHGLAAYKAVFLLMKWASFGGLAFTIWRKRGPIVAACFSVLLASCGAFFFYGKVFSPEFEMLALTALSICLIWQDDFRLTWRSCFSLVAALLATAIKPTAVPILFAVLTYCGVSLHQAKRDRAEKILFHFIAAAIALLIVCIPLFTADGRESFVAWNARNTGRQFSIENIKTWITYHDVTWDLIPISGAVGYLGVFGALTVSLLSATRLRSLHNRSRLAGYTFIVCGLLGWVAAISASAYCDWYLWVSAILILAGSAMAIDASDHPLALLIVICIGVFSTSIHETARRTGIRLEVLHGLDSSQAMRPAMSEVIREIRYPCGGRVVIATDMLAALDTTERPDIAVLRARDFVSGGGLQSKQQVFNGIGVLPTSFFTSNAGDDIPLLPDITHIIVNDRLTTKSLGQFEQLGGISQMTGALTMGGNRFTLIRTVGDQSIYQRAQACTGILANH